jgi:nicotinate-nucleotide adenylyltransferase
MTAARRAPALRIGILGGTFNPIHLGHLRSAEEVREALRLDRVLFVPSATPPHKPGGDLAAAAHRLALVRRAIAGHPAFRVSTLEIERRGRSYSVDTLRALRAQLPQARLFFILGMDAFREIATWKDYRAIFALCHLVVTSRPAYAAKPLRAAVPVAVRAEFCYGTTREELEHRTGNRIIFRRITALDISASAIRRRLSRGLSIRYLVPVGVERYIARHGLYARKVTHR